MFPSFIYICISLSLVIKGYLPMVGCFLFFFFLFFCKKKKNTPEGYTSISTPLGLLRTLACLFFFIAYFYFACPLSTTSCFQRNARFFFLSQVSVRAWSRMCKLRCACQNACCMTLRVDPTHRPTLFLIYFTYDFFQAFTAQFVISFPFVLTYPFPVVMKE
uniref:WGS project CAEQ00000000 data, annotated contig 1420 n=1 Tax=Trypanosoma congolense (strain IL3000) TaxID=1068625 RepID=F9W638_TRYCI|nr:unnamed protein product [Trypanosoma congolense IL3000]